MKVRLNLATSPLDNVRRFVVGAAVVGTFALATLVLLSFRAYRSWHAERDLRAEVSRLEREIANYQQQRQQLAQVFEEAGNRQLRDRAAFLNNLIEQRSFPWTKIFMDLEQTLPDGVRVVSISPRMENGHVEVKLVVGALSDESKLKFLRALEQSPAFSRVQLVSEMRPERKETADRVLLELIAWYETS